MALPDADAYVQGALRAYRRLLDEGHTYEIPKSLGAARTALERADQRQAEANKALRDVLQWIKMRREKGIR